ncbi:hypothetical protein DNTS_016698 [Danionella cerebrum]|uniref:Uncharacterized protein n=1 Tax=Danionella cerebrum TaxID=2873325 RepID=A0A553QEE7_9TELE|nr:hypothetical protein DNTS_016698 [Danionella translucida]
MKKPVLDWQNIYAHTMSIDLETIPCRNHERLVNERPENAEYLQISEVCRSLHQPCGSQGSCVSSPVRQRAGTKTSHDAPYLCGQLIQSLSDSQLKDGEKMEAWSTEGLFTTVTTHIIFMLYLSLLRIGCRRTDKPPRIRRGGVIMKAAQTDGESGAMLPDRTSGAVKMMSIRLVFWIFLPALSLCAPPQETVSDDSLPSDLANPFSSREDNRRLLHNFIKSNLKEQNSPELNTREQEVGRWMVVSMVDYLLQTQDLNQDGLLAPSDLLSTEVQDKNITIPIDRATEEGLNLEDTNQQSEDVDPKIQEAELKGVPETHDPAEEEQEQILEQTQEKELQDDNQERNTLEQMQPLEK